jgi:hypothetical protein
MFQQEIAAMIRYIIERDVPGIGGLNADEKKGAAAKSNAALAQLAPRVQWDHSYLAGDKTFCVYLAEDEAAIHEHSKLSGFPANKVTVIKGMLDPTYAN